MLWDSVVAEVSGHPSSAAAATHAASEVGLAQLLVPHDPDVISLASDRTVVESREVSTSTERNVGRSMVFGCVCARLCEGTSVKNEVKGQKSWRLG